MKEISAGGVVYRKQDGELTLLMIKDRFGKVTVAKGKQEPGETLMQTAIREIEEETGIKGELGPLLEIVHYTYEHPIQRILVEKEVHYYLVKALTDQVTVQVEEIDTVQWLKPEAAWELHEQAGYENNRSVLQKALDTLGIQVI
ncbi:NUDIX hydrolase [Brevibacillus laterosporus]|uniref:NTP pyrophosphohydrolase n=1 Tax=Brevibacillus laterosporus TaxID=1465 RepID=A0AAP3DFE3_BRELA|nr:NUDIX domain-containing protein [Brevibacillus laterosporus]MCR8978934.1 NUDIX domain-containing protein [Brevibacillus laterosporus]MCZ0806090.1 NUDIX domain-containing protein [Brevibacillus laterosporus]MCZ0824163.1 NUDIX domain-containing protein [Brevibacillus laterosporus]MCZ0848070.1 NUDIX domain-containing protein [Brevibacillus laterosporus]MED1664280.1 NUDIX domain-containing protein [Brevibacillus laterosporus]